MFKLMLLACLLLTADGETCTDFLGRLLEGVVVDTIFKLTILACLLLTAGGETTKASAKAIHATSKPKTQANRIAMVKFFN